MSIYDEYLFGVEKSERLIFAISDGLVSFIEIILIGAMSFWLVLI